MWVKFDSSGKVETFINFDILIIYYSTSYPENYKCRGIIKKKCQKCTWRKKINVESRKTRKMQGINSTSRLLYKTYLFNNLWWHKISVQRTSVNISRMFSTFICFKLILWFMLILYSFFIRRKQFSKHYVQSHSLFLTLHRPNFYCIVVDASLSFVLFFLCSWNLLEMTIEYSFCLFYSLSEKIFENMVNFPMRKKTSCIPKRFFF